MHAKLESFVADLQRIRNEQHEADGFLAALRPPFEALMQERDWVQPEWLRVIPGDVASWAIFRQSDPGLCIFAMVVPPGSETKVHNHLTNGWIGLYQGEQMERKFLRDQPDDPSRRCDIHEVDRLTLSNGAITFLKAPEEDIHQIRTISDVASVSIHVLANDLGTVSRQWFAPSGEGTWVCQDFISGYSDDSSIARAQGIGDPGDGVHEGGGQVSKPTQDDAKLVVELARWGSQPELLRARKFVYGARLPKTYRQFQKKYAASSDEVTYLHAFAGYYETVATLVRNRVLSEDLVNDWLAVDFAWSKVQRLLEGLRAEAGARMYENFEWLARRSAEWTPARE
jgi:predicted metal-dependent enzyme (double-stranded beta helix superfamily)